jgi:hypothetical protein
MWRKQTRALRTKLTRSGTQLFGVLKNGPTAFNLNGIVATPDGDTLIVGHFANGLLYTVDPESGSGAVIEGLYLPDADGLELRGRRLWVGQVFENQVSGAAQPRPVLWRRRREVGSGALTLTRCQPVDRV